MLFSKKKGVPVLAPLTGKVIAVSEIDDPIFSAKIVGDGVAIIPETGGLYAPVSGVVTFIAEQKHSFGITTDDGVEVLVHIGVDTLKLNGEGFQPQVSKGERVNAGDLICRFNLEFIKSKGFDPTTPVLITSGVADKIKKLVIVQGHAEATKTVCMRYVI